MASNLDTLVTVFGGSGFLGRNVVRALCKRDYRIRVAVRRPELAGHLQPGGKVGQIHAVQANLRYPASIEAAMRDSHVAINLVGILAESGAQTFEAVQGQVDLDAELPQELGLLALFGTLAGLLILDGTQGVASLLQHPAELAKAVAKVSEAVGESELHVGGGRRECGLHRLETLQ